MVTRERKPDDDMVTMTEANGKQHQDPSALTDKAARELEERLRREIEGVEQRVRNEISGAAKFNKEKFKNVNALVLDLKATIAATAKTLAEAADKALAKTEQFTKDQLQNAEKSREAGDAVNAGALADLKKNTDNTVVDIKKWLPGGESVRADKRGDNGQMIALVTAAVLVISILLQVFQHQQTVQPVQQLVPASSSNPAPVTIH